jgi:hypothetical protein
LPSFSSIVQTPAVRAVVQSGLLTREFKDALFPRLLYRGEAIPAEFPTHVGDTLYFTGKGLLPRNVAPLVPGTDPLPQTYPVEQWSTQIQKYAGTIDTDMPTDIASIVKLFLENTKQLGLQAALSLNTGARDQAYNAALSGWTVVKTGSSGSGVTSVPVKSLNGFTRARRPDLAASGGSAVAFNPVSTTNPLAVVIDNTGTPQSVNVTGFVADNPGDETGPGTLTVDSAVTFASRSYVIASDRSAIVRAAAGNTLDALGSASIFTPSLIRAAVARLRTMNVPTFSGSGYYHCHLDPTSETQLYADQEFQRLNASIPDYVLYKELALGTMQGTVFFTDTENPLPSTVLTVASDGITYTPADPFAGELYTNGATSGLVVHRPIFLGQGGLQEFGQNQDEMITMAGLNGKVGDFDISNNGIEINSDGVKLILRAPQNRTQDVVSSTWLWMGSWTFRTDATTGDSARHKRAVCVEHT